MSSIIDIAVKDLRLRLRDRSVLIVGIITPLVLAAIFNLVFGNVLSGEGGLELEYAVVDLDGSPTSAAFVDLVDQLADDGVLALREVGGVDDAQHLVEDGELDAVWIVPDGFDSDVTAGRSSTIEIVGSVDAPVAVGIARSIAARFGLGIQQVALDIATAVALGASLVDTPDLVETAIAAPPLFVLADSSAASHRLDAATSTMAGLAIFFLFFTVQFAVTSLLEEQREGTLARLVAAPIPRWAPIVAKALGGFVLGVSAMSVLMVASHFLLGATWGPIPAVALIVVAGVGAAVGIMGIVAAFATTPESAGNIQSIVGVVLGLLGGSFFPVGRDGGVLDQLQYLTPHAWFLRGLGDLAGEGTVASVLPAVGALTVFAVLTSGLAFLFLRRRHLL